MGIEDVHSLSTIDHAICRLNYNGRTYWLDATNDYIRITHIPSAIQGRNALYGKDGKGIVETIPTLKSTASVDSLHYELQLNLNGKPSFSGTASANWKGDLKEWAMNNLLSTDKESADKAISDILNADDQHA